MSLFPGSMVAPDGIALPARAAWVNLSGVEFFSPGSSEGETLEQQGSSENGKPSRAGGGAPRQLPTSPNIPDFLPGSNPAHSQSGIN
jgi:hypothetical protein